MQPAELDLSTLAVDLDVSTVNALRDDPDVLLIDVREQYEYDEGHIPGITLMPLGTIPNRLNEIPTDKEVVFICRSGNRSNQATQFLQQQGFDNVHNMLGGMNDWADDIAICPNLNAVIQVLKFLAGMNPDGTGLVYDMDGDDRITSADAIFILQTVAGVR